MRAIVDLHEEIDEVNYFLTEWQSLLEKNDSRSVAIAKPEIKFVSHAIEKVITQANQLNIPIVLKNGHKPILARKDRNIIKQNQKRNLFNWMIPSHSTVKVNYCTRFETKSGSKLTYIGNDNGLISLKTLAETLRSGGQLQIQGRHSGDWSA